MENGESDVFVEKIFKKGITAVIKYTADIQAKLIPQRIAKSYDRSECCAITGILVGSVILLLSWFMVRGISWTVLIKEGLDVLSLRYAGLIRRCLIVLALWWDAIIRGSLVVLALWWATGAFSYPVKVVLVDIPSGGGIKSPIRSIILLFFNYIEIIIHFASVYLLSLSIGNSGCQTPITCPLEAIYFSIVTITTLGYGDIRPISRIGRILVSLQVLIGIVLIVTVLARFLQLTLKNRDEAGPEESKAEGK